MTTDRIEGRPDFKDHNFGVTHLKRFPKYVYAKRGFLIHKIAEVDLRWWTGVWDHMERLDPPTMIARTVCGQSVFLNTGRYGNGQMCAVPKPEAVLCGRCRGEQPTFRKGVNPGLTRQIAKLRLGCIASGSEI